MKGPARREELLFVLRRLGLLGLAERYAIRRDVAAAHDANTRFLEKYEGPNLPSPALVRRTYGDASLRGFRQWGQANAEEIESVLSRHIDLASARVAEWGCGLGRLAMHLAPKTDYTGFDIDGSSLAWCRENYPGTYRRNVPMPPLPAEEGRFDAVFAVSIFTHLTAAQNRRWAAEIRRVLKPGGIFVFTVHGEGQAGKLLPAERRRFRAGELVTRGGVRRGSRTYLAYHPNRYVEEVLMDGYEVVEGPVEALGQTLYVGRRPPS